MSNFNFSLENELNNIFEENTNTVSGGSKKIKLFENEYNLSTIIIAIFIIIIVGTLICFAAYNIYKKYGKNNIVEIIEPKGQETTSNT